MITEEVILIVGCFTGWLLLGALALQISANRFFKKTVLFKRAILTQLAMIWVLPIWTNAYFTKFTDRFIEPHPEVSYLLPILCIIPQFLIVMYSFRIRTLPAFACLVISLAPCYAAFQLAMPSWVLVGGARASVTKANGEMRSLGKNLQEWNQTEGSLPLPVDHEGHTLAGTPHSASEEETLFFYEGPSLLPPDLLRMTGGEALPEDPFKRRRPATYSYAAGPIHGATARFILSSWGPDEVDQSDDVEQLFLIECEGDIHRFIENEERFELMYSPTNGIVSPGELFRPGEGQ